MANAGQATPTVDELIEEACARNTPAELHYEATNGDRAISRVRLMALTKTEVLTDAPVPRPGDRGIPPNRPITVHFMLQSVRRQFNSAIVKGAVEVRLNARQTVRGIALRRPGSTEESQRRADFRQSLASCEPILVAMSPAARDVRDACVLDAPRPTGRLVEISSGGLGLLLERALLPGLRPDTPFFLDFTLPDVEEPFCMFALSRHIRELHKGDSLRIGWQFKDWGTCTLQADQRRIARFVAAFQRKTLQRRA